MSIHPPQNHGNPSKKDFEFAHLQKIVFDAAPALFAVSLLGGGDGVGNESALSLQLATASTDFFSKRLTVAQIRNELVEIATTQAMDSGDDKAVHRLVQLITNASTGASQKEHKKRKQQQQQTIAFSKSDGDDGVRLAIKERLPSGIVRTLFTTTLTKTDRNSGIAAEDNLLQLSLRMLQRQDHLVAELEAMKQQYEELERARDEWQQTAETLEGAWEREKTQLFANFCDLYTEKQKHSRTREQDLQARIQELGRQVEEARQQQGGRQHHRPMEPMDESLQNIPGDADQEMFDAETAQRLAEGRRVVLPKPPSRAAAPPQPRKRRNQTLGTVEYFDVDAALEDVEEEKQREPDEEEEEEKKPAYSAKVAKKPKPSAPSGKKEESDSDTASEDDDVVISSTKANTLALLKSMRDD